MPKAETKTRGKRKEKKAAAPPSPPPVSAATYVDRRDERIAYYYFVRRVVKPPAIYDFLVRECRECLEPIVATSHADDSASAHVFTPLISDNRASGLRTIEKVVMRLREEAEPEEVLKLRRPIETAKVQKTWEHLLQIELDIINDRSTIKRQRISPRGGIVTVVEERYSEQDRNRARKNAIVLAEKLGKIAGATFVAVDDPESQGKGAGGEVPVAEPYTFSFPNVKGKADDLDVMIAMNLGREKLN